MTIRHSEFAPGMMSARRRVVLVTLATLLWLQPFAFADANEVSRDVRDLVAAAVSERLGNVDSLDIEVLEAPADAGSYESATPAPGARLGSPIRFTLTGAGLPTASLLARVNVVAAHVVALQPIARNAAIAAGSVDVRHAPLDDVLLQPLPSLDEVLGGRPRRALAAGEIVTATVVARTPAVRAGEEVSITIRSGAIEARGIGRAASSGFVGDVIRVTRPGSREPVRARVLAAASVEILQ